MQIIKSDSEKMILAEPGGDSLSGGGISGIGLLVGAGFVAVSSAMILSIMNEASVLELNCQRTAKISATKTVNCITREYRFWGLIPSSERKIDQIRSVKITFGNWVALETASKGIVPLRIRGSESDASKFVNEFNSFVAGDQSSSLPNNFVYIIYDGRYLLFPFMILFVGLFLKIGISLVIASLSLHEEEKEHIILDKTQQSLTWKLPDAPNPMQYKFSQIATVEVHCTKIENRPPVFQVYLLVKSGELILIEEVHFHSRSANHQAKQLAEFLDVPIHDRSL